MPRVGRCGALRLPVPSMTFDDEDGFKLDAFLTGVARGRAAKKGAVVINDGIPAVTPGGMLPISNAAELLRPHLRTQGFRLSLMFEGQQDIYVYRLVTPHERVHFYNVAKVDAESNQDWTKELVRNWIDQIVTQELLLPTATGWFGSVVPAAPAPTTTVTQSPPVDLDAEESWYDPEDAPGYGSVTVAPTGVSDGSTVTIGPPPLPQGPQNGDVIVVNNQLRVFLDGAWHAITGSSAVGKDSDSAAPAAPVQPQLPAGLTRRIDLDEE